MPRADRLPFIPFKTSFSGFSELFRTFPAFLQIQAALAYPSDHFWPDGQKCRIPLLYGF